MGIPAFVMGIPYKILAPKNPYPGKSPEVDFQAVCDFHSKEIDKLEENIKKLAQDVDLKSELYKMLNESKSVCSVLEYRVLPDCATKEGMNVSSKLDDECAEEKTEIMKSTFLRKMNLDKALSGKDIFRSCKDIAAKGLLKQFKEMQSLISGLCYETQSGSSRRRRSIYGGGYYYDPSTVWFQYLLCQEQKITCYFFTQGWNQLDYGQYYLYQNALDTDVATPDDATPDVTSDDDDFLAFALLSDIGTQKYYPNKGYPAYLSPAYPSFRRRRETEDEEANEDALLNIEDEEEDEEAIDTDTDLVACTGNACD